MVKLESLRVCSGFFGFSRVYWGFLGVFTSSVVFYDLKLFFVEPVFYSKRRTQKGELLETEGLSTLQRYFF